MFIFGSCAANESQNLQTNVTGLATYKINADEVNKKLSNHDNFYLIDVRTEEENAELKIPNSKLIALDDLSNTIINDRSISFDDEIVVYCRSGNRSKAAYDILTKLGYTNVKSMTGGIIAWSKSGYNTCSELNNTC